MRVWRWLLPSALGLGIVVAGLLPRWRLSEEMDAARREGLWTSYGALREALHLGPGRQNAVPLIERERFRVGTSPADPRPDLSEWRRIADSGVADNDVAWTKDDPFLYTSASSLCSGADLLRKAAKEGDHPRENIEAAGRLLRLVAAEPSIAAQQMRLASARQLLTTAGGLHLEGEAAKAIGPTPDWRRMLGAELATALSAVDRLHDELSQTIYPFVRFRLSGPFGDNARRRIVHVFRDALRRLPADPSRVDDALLQSIRTEFVDVVVSVVPRFRPSSAFPVEAKGLKQMGLFEEARKEALGAG